MRIRIMCFDLYRKLVVARGPGSPVPALLRAGPEQVIRSPSRQGAHLMNHRPHASSHLSARVCKRVAARQCVVITMEGDCAGTAG